MGWSCGYEASKTLQAWTTACVAQGGNSNTYKVGENTFFFEVSRTEHADGAITGTIMKMVPAPAEARALIAPTKVEQELFGGEPQTFYARRAGSFRIEGDGTVARAPAFLKKASKRAA